MDRKSIIAIAVCVLLLFGLNHLTRRIYPDIPVRPAPTNNVAVQAQPAPVNQTSTPATSTPPSIGPDMTPKFVFDSNAEEQTIVLSNQNARYTFTSLGGGLKEIELLHYPEKVTRHSKKQPLADGLATLNTHAPVPVLAVLGGDSVQGDGIFVLTQQTADGVRAEKTLTNGLRLVKEFHLGTNYLVNATVRLENTSGQPLALPAQEWVVGTATPMAADDSGMIVGMMWYDGAKKTDTPGTWFENRGFMCTKGIPRTEYRVATSNVVWTSAYNQFFALVAMPKDPAQEIVSRPVELPRPDADEIPENMKQAGPPKGYQTALVYPAVVLNPDEKIEREFHFFAGPKEYRTLARIAERFQNNVDQVMNFGWAGFFSKGLLLGMNWLHNTFKFSYGWAIIVITIIIKLLFWPLTQASTRSMKRMAALQPQMKALQAKYKDDPAKMNKKVMEFWKEHKVNPMGGCLPMLLQIPVFFGFFSMIQTAIELRGASFLWVADLSKPDTLFLIPGTHFPFNLLPLLMGVTMLWQSHLTPPSPGMDPAQAKMMKYMPLMFLVFLYNYSAGLALYWTAQNLLTILQTKLTKTNEPAPAAVSPLTPTPKKKK